MQMFVAVANKHANSFTGQLRWWTEPAKFLLLNYVRRNWQLTECCAHGGRAWNALREAQVPLLWKRVMLIKRFTAHLVYHQRFVFICTCVLLSSSLAAAARPGSSRAATNYLCDSSRAVTCALHLASAQIFHFYGRLKSHSCHFRLI